MKIGKKFSKPHLSRVANGDVATFEPDDTSKPAKVRLDTWIANNYDAINRARAQKMIKDGKVSVNGLKNVSSSQLVGVGDKIDVDTTRPTIEVKDLPIIYEDDDVLVIDKPVGVLTHAKGAENSEFTVADFALHKAGLKIADTNRFGIVHRLDRATSGVMITAKNDETRVYLQKQFSNRKVKKTYYALVAGHLKQPAALIDLPLARNLKHPTTFVVDPNGRAAQTKYEVIQDSPKYSLVKLTPATGRTHQLRVHMAYLGHPIVGDRVYNPACKSLTRKAGRLFLHAGELEITLPGGKRQVFTSPLPPEFKEKL